MIKYYQITGDKMVQITFEEYEELPSNQKHMGIESSNTLGENLKLCNKSHIPNKVTIAAMKESRDSWLERKRKRANE